MKPDTFTGRREGLTLLAAALQETALKKEWAARREEARRSIQRHFVGRVANVLSAVAAKKKKADELGPMWGSW